jgi:excisionase family DNA binding protein
MAEDRPKPLLLRIREVAAVLAVSERTVWTLVRSGNLPAIHPVGLRAIRITREDVEALVVRWRSECLENPHEAV